MKNSDWTLLTLHFTAKHLIKYTKTPEEGEGKNEVLGGHEEVRLGLSHGHTLSLWFLCQLQTGRAFSYSLPGGAQKHFRGSGEKCFLFHFYCKSWLRTTIQHCTIHIIYRAHVFPVVPCCLVLIGFCTVNILQKMKTYFPTQTICMVHWSHVIILSVIYHHPRETK